MPDNNFKNKANKIEQLLKKLDDKEYLFNESLKIAKIGSYVYDIIKDEWSCTEVLENLFGITSDYKKDSEGWLNIIHPDNREEMRSYLFNRIIQNRENFNKIYLIQSIDKKELKWVHGIGELLTDGQNNPLVLIGTIQDISDKVHIEEELKNILKLSDDLVCITHLDSFSFIKTNQAFRKILGYSKNEIQNKHIIEFIHPNDIEKTKKEQHEKLLKGEKVDHFINRFLAKNGSYKWLEWISLPILEEGIAYEIAHDISKRISIEQDLKESERRFKFSLKNTDIFVSNQDLELKYTWFFGHNSVIAEKDIIGKTDSDIFHKNDAKKIIQIKKEALKTGKNQNEIISLQIDERKRYFKLYVEPLFDNQGNIIGISTTSDDITDLEETKRKAEESDRLKSNFLSNLSHEIRTPMNGIVGFSQLLIESDISEEKRKQYAELINESGRQLLNIINDIIDFSKIESGQIDVNLSKISLNEKLYEIYGFFKPLIKNDDINLFLIKGLIDDDCMIYTDSTKIQQIISNLLNNALKFTSQGYIEFGYHVKGSFIEFYVKDTGLGINPEFQDKIFDRFSQEESNRNPEQGGTGLGLSISKAYVELLGGNIWLKSKPGRGTTFYFTVPYKPAKEISEEEKQDGTENSDILDFSSKTILIAEDNDMNFMLLEELLMKSGAKIIRAINGLEAVEFCKKLSNTDLVLMDIKMPLMNGYEAIEKIKEYNPDIPIIAQSAFAMIEDEKKAIEIGANDYISKPIKGTLLINKIIDIFKNEVPN